VNQRSLRRRPALKTRAKSAEDKRRCERAKPCGCAAPACSFVTTVPADRASDSESGAALGAPAGQHLPAILGRHASPEAVGPFTPQIARLVGAFHRADSVPEVPCANPPRACEKDGESYVRRCGVSTRAALLAGPARAVDNSAPAR
jgi:hypothetical protein